MENRINDNEQEQFEQLLRDETSNHMMFPSDHIWENIRYDLHGNKSWPALSVISILIIAALTVFTFINYPPKTIIEKEILTVNTNSNNPIPENSNYESIEEQLDPISYTSKTLAIINASDNISDKPLLINDIIVDKSSDTKSILKNSDVAIQTQPLINNYYPSQLNINSDWNDNISSNEENTNTVTESNKKTKTVRNIPFIGSEKDNDPAVDAYLKEFGVNKANKTISPNKFSLQFYLTPSVSYRKLDDDKQRSNYISFLSVASSQNPTASINDAVRHTPALGLELGANILYKITKSLKIKSGLQFNVRQYYIDAYQNYGMATIAFVQDNHLDSVSMLAAFGNNNGYYKTKLDNKLYQVSIPIGLQWDFIQGKKIGLSAGASIQPTFTLNKNVYAISTDYKYYANGAPFFRIWNWNSSFDLSFSYQAKDTKWYIGPQIRYQHLPTYNDVYPIKEYRWDYGLKIGVIKSLSSK